MKNLFFPKLSARTSSVSKWLMVCLLLFTACGNSIEQEIVTQQLSTKIKIINTTYENISDYKSQKDKILNDNGISYVSPAKNLPREYLNVEIGKALINSPTLTTRVIILQDLVERQFNKLSKASDIMKEWRDDKESVDISIDDIESLFENMSVDTTIEHMMKDVITDLPNKLENAKITAQVALDETTNNSKRQLELYTKLDSLKDKLDKATNTAQIALKETTNNNERLLELNAKLDKVMKIGIVPSIKLYFAKKYFYEYMCDERTNKYLETMCDYYSTIYELMNEVLKIDVENN